MREMVTATLKVTTKVNVILILSVSEEGSNGPLPRAFDSAHRADHETTTGDALNVKVSSQQTFRQHARSCNVRSPPPAVP